MKMPRDLVVFRRRIVGFPPSSSLGTAACMTLLRAAHQGGYDGAQAMLEEFKRAVCRLRPCGQRGRWNVRLASPDIHGAGLPWTSRRVAVECGGWRL